MSPLLYLLFAVSGALGLVYEVVWMRELHLAFGGGAPAVATVLAVFMLGLALGAALLGRFMTRCERSPWLVYGVLELLVGMFASAFPFALQALDPWFKSAYGTALFSPVRLLGAAVLLLPPTMCLGGTLPVMARAIECAPSRFARNLTWLYTANTGGAALGAFLACFVLLPALGLRATQLSMAVFNVIVGGVAIAWGSRGPGTIVNPDGAEARVRPAKARKPDGAQARIGFLSPWLALTLAFASGFAVLLLEVATTRILSISLGQSTYGFGMMLACLILGLALGAWFVARRTDASAASSRTIAVASLSGGVAIGLMLLVLNLLPGWLARGQLAIHGSPAPFTIMVGFQFLLALAALLPPVAVLGTIFPLLLGSAGAGTSESSGRVGLLYAANTVGAVLAALAGGLLLVPAIGPRGVIMVAGAVATASGLLVLAIEARADRGYRPRALALCALPVASLALFVMTARFDPQVLARSPWLYSRTPDEYDDYQQEMARNARSVEFIANDAHGTVAVGTHHETQPPTRFFSVNGKIDGSTSEEDMRTQVALGTWPCLLFAGGRRDPQHALVIGLGTGVTAGAALSFPLTSLDVIDISPTIPAVARRFFGDVNRAALDDPRTRLLIGDGRHHLEYAKRTYDVIVSEPSNPWISGIGFLYTRESYQAMRAALSDSGVACQWLQLYDLTPSAIASAIGTFASVFPASMVLTTQDQPSDLLLIGFKNRRADGKLFDAEDVAHAFTRHTMPVEYAPYAAGGMGDFVTHFMLGPEGMAEASRGVPLNTDDNAFLEFEAPRQLATEGDMTAASDLIGARREPAIRVLAMPGEASGPFIDDSMNLALYWRLWSQVHVDALDFVERPAQGVRQIPLDRARAAEVALADFMRLYGECSLYHHLAGALAEMRPLPGVQPVTLERYGPGYEPAAAREHFERGVALAPSALVLKLDLAANYEFGARGDRFGEGAELHKAAEVYRQILDRAPDFEEVRVRLAEVLEKGAARRQGL